MSAASGESTMLLNRLTPVTSDEKFFSYIESEGLNNQRIALENAISMSVLLNRTLILPEALPPHDGDTKEPLLTCMVWNCSALALAVPWIGSKQFSIAVKLADAERTTCSNVSQCEDALLSPPATRLLEADQDKIAFHMGLLSPKRWILSELQKKKGIPSHVLRLHDRFLEAAKSVIASMGGGEFDAAHLRGGDTFEEIYPQEARDSYLRTEALIHSTQLPVFVMANPKLIPKNWRVFTSSLDPMVARWSLAERGVVEQLVAANSRHFVGSELSTMTEYVLRLRGTRPTWSVLLPSAEVVDKSVDCSSPWCTMKQKQLHVSMETHETSVPPPIISSGDTCDPWSAADVQESPSCNPHAKETVRESKCCPPCCKNVTTGICGSCDMHRCLSDHSPPFSKAYASKWTRWAFNVVLHRPLNWTAPISCFCPSTGESALVKLLTPPPPSESDWTAGFEESLRHRAPELARAAGCCVPPMEQGWFTRSIECEFQTMSCQHDSLKLLGGSDGRLSLPVKFFRGAHALDLCGNNHASCSHWASIGECATNIQWMSKNCAKACAICPRKKQGAALCVARLDRATASAKLASGDLEAWLSVHAERDFVRTFFYSDDCLRGSNKSWNSFSDNKTIADELKNLATRLPSKMIIEVVELSSYSQYNGWYHHQILAAQDCFSRAAAADVAWVAFLDIDEFLVIPPGWSSLYFGGTKALSFGSKNPCSLNQPSPCAHTFNGHRKFALSTATSPVDHNLPTPPLYIHGDPRETKFNTDGGVFILHIRSECNATIKALNKTALSRASDRGWLDRQLQIKGWRKAISSRTLANKTSTVSWIDGQNVFCVPFIFDEHRRWAYELSDFQLGTLSNDAPSATSSNFPSENGSEIQHDPFTISQPTHISKALQDAVPPTVGNLPLESASIYDDYLQPNVASIVTDQVVTFACLVWGVAFTALIWHMCMTKWFRKKPHGTQVRKDFETEDSMTKLKSNDMDSDCGYPPSPHTWPLQGKSHQL